MTSSVCVYSLFYPLSPLWNSAVKTQSCFTALQRLTYVDLLTLVCKKQTPVFTAFKKIYLNGCLVAWNYFYCHWKAIQNEMFPACRSVLPWWCYFHIYNSPVHNLLDIYERHVSFCYDKLLRIILWRYIRPSQVFSSLFSLAELTQRACFLHVLKSPKPQNCSLFLFQSQVYHTGLVCCAVTMGNTMEISGEFL